MSERKDSHEECVVMLMIHNEDVRSENVNTCTPSHSDKEFFPERNELLSSRSVPQDINSQPAGANASLMLVTEQNPQRAGMYASPLLVTERNSQHVEAYASPTLVIERNPQDGRAYASPMFITVGNPVSVHGAVYDFSSSFTERNTQHAGVYSFLNALPCQFLAPSSVTSLPSVDNAAWCPSPTPLSVVDRYRVLVPGIGVNVRGPNPSTRSVPSLMMLQSGLSLRPETPYSPSDCAMAAEKKKDEEDLSELCALLDGTSLGTSDPFNLPVAVKIEDGAMSLSAAAEGVDYEDDDEITLADVVLLQESIPGNAGMSKELAQSSASAVDLSSVKEDIGDCSSFALLLQKDYARGLEQGCCGYPGKVKLDKRNPLHCDPSPGSWSSAQVDAGSINTLGVNLLDPPDSAQLHAVAGREAEPPDTGQSTESGDDDLHWASCKICWLRMWKFVFIPCGHASCKPCYRQLYCMPCPFCRECIREIVEVQLSHSLEDNKTSA